MKKSDLCQEFQSDNVLSKLDNTVITINLSKEEMLWFYKFYSSFYFQQFEEYDGMKSNLSFFDETKKYFNNIRKKVWKQLDKVDLGELKYDLGFRQMRSKDFLFGGYHEKTNYDLLYWYKSLEKILKKSDKNLGEIRDSIEKMIDSYDTIYSVSGNHFLDCESHDICEEVGRTFQSEDWRFQEKYNRISFDKKELLHQIKPKIKDLEKKIQKREENLNIQEL